MTGAEAQAVSKRTFKMKGVFVVFGLALLATLVADNFAMPHPGPPPPEPVRGLRSLLNDDRGSVSGTVNFHGAGFGQHEDHGPGCRGGRGGGNSTAAPTNTTASG